MKNTMSKFLIGVITSAILCTNMAFAESVYNNDFENFKNNKLIVTGDGQENETVVLQILQDGKSFDDLSSGDPNTILLWQGQVTVGADKKFKFTVPYLPALPAGNYASRITSYSRTVPETATTELVGTTTYGNALSDMLTAADTTNYALFKQCIGDNASPVRFDLSFFKKLGISPSSSLTAADTSKLSAYMDYIKNNERADFASGNYFDEDAIKRRSAYFNTFVLMEVIKDGNIEFDIKEQLEGSSVPISDAALWNDIKTLTKTPEEWNYLKNKIKGNASKITDIDSFKTVLIEGLVLTETKYADGDDIKDILTKYGTQVGISSVTARKDVYLKMSSVDYADIGALKTAYNTLISTPIESTSPYSTGGSGGGGTGIPSIQGGFSSTQGSTPPVKITVPFIDIEGVTWASEAIIALYHKGIIAGKENDYFDPDGDITREEFAKILVCSLGLEEELYSQNHFNDVKESDWFYKYVNIAYEKGLVNGVGQGNFGSNKKISRQDMVVMLCNALEYKGFTIETSETSFADNDLIAGYARSAVNALNKMGVVNGVTIEQFQPLGNATRAQAARVVYGIIDILQQ